MSRPSRLLRGLAVAAFVAASALTAGVATAGPATAQAYMPISGAGSTWSQTALDHWRHNVNSTA